MKSSQGEMGVCHLEREYSFQPWGNHEVIMPDLTSSFLHLLWSKSKQGYLLDSNVQSSSVLLCNADLKKKENPPPTQITKWTMRQPQAMQYVISFHRQKSNHYPQLLNPLKFYKIQDLSADHLFINTFGGSCLYLACFHIVLSHYYLSISC